MPSRWFSAIPRHCKIRPTVPGLQAILSEEYRKANQDLIDRIDALAASISPQEENRLCELFEKCCLFDLRFWDMAYAMGNC